MTDDILKEILVELKGLRQESMNTNKRIDETNSRLESLDINLNKRVDSLDKNLSNQIKDTNSRLDILSAEIGVLVISSNETRDGINAIRKSIPNVIWQNDTIAITEDEEIKVQGVIHKIAA
ncbi:MAG: hypothetical protein KGZ58_01395 [Ignavibacteriales bacterium]|nr:hypothetical protein [Ignavibacteriales bacterium]